MQVVQREDETVQGGLLALGHSRNENIKHNPETDFQSLHTRNLID